MGRQAEFFATPEDIKELVDFFISRGGQIVDEKNGMNIENDVVNYDINTPFIVHYIVLDKSKLVFSKGGINILDSDAIELKLPRPNGFKRDENRRLIIEPAEQKLDKIQESVENVLRFLELEKQARQRGNLRKLAEIADDYKVYCEDETFCNSRNQIVQQIQVNALQDIEFYHENMLMDDSVFTPPTAPNGGRGLRSILKPKKKYGLCFR